MAKKMVEGKDIPQLRRDISFFPSSSDGIRITRGCQFKCEFCSITYFYKHCYRKRPIKDVLEELKTIHRKYVYIHDANFTIDLEYCKELFRAMIREKINKKWGANGNIFVLGRDKEFLQLAKKSGCYCWTIGFESVFQKSLNEVKKTANIVEKYSEWIKNIRKHGMAINGLFMFGFDHDTPDVFDKTLEAINQWEIDSSEFNILTPLPGTPTFDKMEKEGRILTKDWSKYTQTQVVFEPKNMTPKELYEGTKKVAKEFYTSNNLFRRFVRLPTLTLTPSTIIAIMIMNISHRIWYKRDFGI